MSAERERLLNWALAHAAKGLWVFPVKVQGKTPAHTGWQEEATRDPDAIRQLWSTQPYNVGIFTERYKEEKALVVIDIDVKAGKDGYAELMRLELQGKDAPPTSTQRTPTGGSHLVFESDYPVKQGANVLGPGLDIRSKGGYVVGAGSVLANGEYVMNDVPIAPAPQWLLDDCGRAPEKPAKVESDLSRVDPVRAQKRAVNYLLTEAPLAIEDASGDDTTFLVACRLKDFGVDQDTAEELMSEHWNDRCSPPWSPEDLAAKVRNAYAYGQEPAGVSAPEAQFPPIEAVDGAEVAPVMTDDGRVVVRYEPEHLADAGRLIERAMLDDTAHEPLLTYEGRYVSIRHSQAVTAIQRLRGAKGRAYIHAHDNESLRARIMESAKVYSWKSNGKAGAWSAVRCPDELVAHLQSSAKRSVPGLTGIITAPTILPDGSDIWTAGYHDASGLYADFDPADFPGIDAIPTQKDAAAARTWLRKELFGEVAFRDETDADVAIAALITGSVRRFLGAAPAFLYVSAMPGSGKSTLMFAISTAVSGGAEPRTWPKNDEEMNKTLLTVLQKNALTINFDNLARGTAIAKESSLAAVLTSESYSGRLLGGNSDALLPASILVQITGNNVRLQDDMPSRIIPCRLDPRMENPAARKFKRNLLDWTAQNRGAIVRAALTIVAAYLRNGKPDVGGDVSRFQDWDKMVRKPLIYAGGSNVVLAMLAAAEDDEAKNHLSEAMEAWGRIFGEDEIKAGEVEKKLDDDFSGQEAKTLRRWIAGEGRAANAVLIGQRMVEVEGQRINGKAFVRRQDSKNGGSWLRLESVEQRPGG